MAGKEKEGESDQIKAMTTREGLSVPGEAVPNSGMEGTGNNNSSI